MDQPAAANRGDTGALRPVFVSYATEDRDDALSVCKAIERRGANCWISMRDVAPGENYQEAIVQSLRTSRAMVLVFSEAANNSDEIKKELSLASRHHVPVIALRLEDVEPSDAFAYELSTRQWVNAFEGWDKSIDSLVGRIAQISPDTSESTPSAQRGSRQRVRPAQSRLLLIGVLSLVLLVAASAWYALRPPPAAAHSMQVRLSGFEILTADLPATMHDAVGAEIIAAFNDDGVVGVSTAAAPEPGMAPAYALGGTIRRDGDSIRVTTRLTNERSGTILWSDSFNYDASQVSRVPRRIAVDAGNLLRCGLFGAATYHKSLPNAVMSDYMQYCQGTANLERQEPSKALNSARKVVAAAPDFSWGWSAIANAVFQATFSDNNSRQSVALRQEGRHAADKALALDSRNSEALANKAFMIDPTDLAGKEELLKRAIAARPLDCGCEHVLYGLMLENVGRFTDAADQFRRATDMLALDLASQLNLADSLVTVGRLEDAGPHFDAAVDLSIDPNFRDEIALIEATETGDYAAGIKAIQANKLHIAEPRRAVILAGFKAMASGNTGAKAQAIQSVVSLPQDQQDFDMALLLGALGANHDALRVASRIAITRADGPSLFWYRSMRGALSDPRFPDIAKQLGLMTYWKKTHTRPDVCNGANPLPFCRMI